MHYTKFLDSSMKMDTFVCTIHRVSFKILVISKESNFTKIFCTIIKGKLLLTIVGSCCFKFFYLIVANYDFEHYQLNETQMVLKYPV